MTEQSSTAYTDEKDDDTLAWVNDTQLKRTKDLASSFVIDPGATKHVMSSHTLFCDYIKFAQPHKVIL